MYIHRQTQSATYLSFKKLSQFEHVVIKYSLGAKFEHKERGFPWAVVIRVETDNHAHPTSLATPTQVRHMVGIVGDMISVRQTGKLHVRLAR